MNKTYKKTIILFLLSMFIFIFIGVFYIIRPHEDSSVFEKPIPIEYDYFIYANGELYYRNKQLCITDPSDVGEEIGIVKYHLKKDSIYNDSFIYYGDNKIYAYAIERLLS